jgi:hypothetical protein
MSVGTFEIASGSVTGRTHLLAGKPNQDAFAHRRRGEHLVAVVCDGCGSGAHSEVGARLGARLVVESIGRQLEAGARAAEKATYERARLEVLMRLEDLARAMGGSLSETVSELFLFTVVGAAIDGEDVCVFSMGDGLMGMGDEILRLGPFPRNAPPYLAYGLLEQDPEESGAPRFEIRRTAKADRVNSILLGTDGCADLVDVEGRFLPGRGERVGPLSQFWTDDRYFQNRDAVRRRLALINREATRALWAEQRIAREPGLLPDDTTLVVIRRGHGSARTDESSADGRNSRETPSPHTLFRGEASGRPEEARDRKEAAPWTST